MSNEHNFRIVSLEEVNSSQSSLCIGDKICLKCDLIINKLNKVVEHYINIYGDKESSDTSIDFVNYLTCNELLIKKLLE